MSLFGFQGMRCIKCGDHFKRSGRLSHSYNEIVLKLDNGSFCHVGICSGCELEPDDYLEMVEWLNKVKIPAKSFLIENRIGCVDVILRSQNGCCSKCGKEIGDKFTVSNGSIFHEGNCLEEKNVSKENLEITAQP